MCGRELCGDEVWSTEMAEGWCWLKVQMVSQVSGLVACRVLLLARGCLWSAVCLLDVEWSEWIRQYISSGDAVVPAATYEALSVDSRPVRATHLNCLSFRFGVQQGQRKPCATLGFKSIQQLLFKQNLVTLPTPLQPGPLKYPDSLFAGCLHTRDNFSYCRHGSVMAIR
ncbi:uncharacterized protein LOC126195276 isoform X2 [Schistocerca nitens]|uniref:uncharacterized protein LOC126195276 isoform X2 n=1 Tax=Schistocerca nitens TaxID=7011 RepID=UPI002118F554|nr:uncharacterized protein LOC126195276 isoform X2 [Schistocerca nitens]